MAQKLKYFFRSSFSVSLAFHKATENLVLQILGLPIVIIFCSWPFTILKLVFYKNSNSVLKIFEIGFFGLGYFRFGILE